MTTYRRNKPHGCNNSNKRTRVALKTVLDVEKQTEHDSGSLPNTQQTKRTQGEIHKQIVLTVIWLI